MWYPTNRSLCGLAAYHWATARTQAAAQRTSPPTAESVCMHVCSAEERKRRLREVAEADRASGKDQQVFKDSEYMMGEDARTPNVHSRQVPPPACVLCCPT